MNSRFHKLLAAALVAATVGSPGAGFADDSTVVDSRFLAFAHHNVERIPDGQIYVGSPHVIPVADWARAAEIEAHLTLLATEGFADEPLGPDIVIINRRSDDMELAFTAFATTLRDMGLDPIETERLWSSSMAAAPCVPLYPREYLAILSVNDLQQAVACASEALYRLRGVGTSYATFADLRASDDTRAADEMLAGALARCATLGWMDSTVRNCVFDRLVGKAELRRPHPRRR